MTGLEVLSSASLFPRIILIEINILDRPVDDEVKSKGIAAAQSRPRPWSILSGVTKPLRYILSKPYFTYLPSEQQAAWWSKRNEWDIANRNFKRIQDLITKFESHGVKIYLLYLPYSAGYGSHTFAQRNREIASGNDDFNCQRCIDVRKLVAIEELRWDDGAHLDDRSALMVAEALQKRLLPEL